MAAANQTTPNEILEKEVIEVSSEVTKMPTIPVPTQRRNKAKVEESSKKIDSTLSVSAIIDNSRVVFLENDVITKNEVQISKDPSNQDVMDKENTCVSSELSEGDIVKVIPPSKSKVASFIEKFNSNTTNSSVNVVICKVDICDPINIPPVINDELNVSNVNGNCSQEKSLKITEAVTSENTNLHNVMLIENNTVKMKEEETIVNESSFSNQENTVAVLSVKEMKPATEETMSTVQHTKDNVIKVPIPAPRSFTLRNLMAESGMISTDTSKSLHLNVVETNLVTNVEKNNDSATKQIDKNISTNDKNSTESKQNNISCSKQEITNTNNLESENNKLLSQTKPTISKKPTTLGDHKKTEKVLTSGKIPIFEKSLSFQDRDLKLKGLRSPAERNTIEFEPKLTKRQRTSSEQCLSSTKGDSEISMIRKLRGAVEQLQQENAVIKKLLESERSAFREQRAVFEAESRKDKAEAKRREASLESQLRTALKGQTMAAVGPTGAVFDNARFVAALESAKTTIKSLQEKLRVALEADKRKAAELRAQHDAHTVVIQQMERDARAQTAKLLEELKTKERQVEKVKKEVKGTSAVASGKPQSKMAVAEQLHQMEGQISRLENEIQRRDDIIQSLRTSKIHRERRLSQRLSKDNIFKDILSDVDSAVSSAPNSLSPQPSPDLWYRHQDGSQVEVEEGLLEAAKKQIQELEKALSLSTAGQKQAQSKVSQLQEQLQDLREHADLLEFRCLELEDSAEKRHSLEELTDSDSGCTSPENRLKNSVSPQLRRSDSGYKSPTRSASPNIKNQRRIIIPPSFPEQDAISCTENYNAILSNLHLQSIESIFENGYSNDEIRDKLEGMLLKTHSESDRICLEQILQLLWNLQALGNSFNDDDFSMAKTRKILENDISKCDLDQQAKSGKIIATVSPYSQKALCKSNDLINTVSSDEVDLANFTLKGESKKILFGLQESGIFEEGDWETKATQTDCYDCVCPEPESDLATEVLRLNQIREQLEKSGAIKNKNTANDCSNNNNSSPLIDLKQQRRRDKKKVELYESRIALLESKLSVYESSDEVRQKKLAQRLQREIDLQTKVKNLEFDFGKLKKKYIILEEERCELEEAENDTRFHCQELEAELDILSAKLRDIDDQRSCARNEAECYRQLVEEYEYKIMTMQQNENDMKHKADIMEKLVPVLVSYNIYSLLEEITAKNSCCGNTCCAPCGGECDGSCGPTFGPVLMLEYPDGELKDLGQQLSSLANQNMQMKALCQDNMNSPGAGGGINRSGPQRSGKDDKGSQYDDNTIYSSGFNSGYNNTRGLNSTQRSNNTQGLNNTMGSSDETKLKLRIEELEKRELAYLETLTKGDEMWAEMETGYKAKLKELEENENHLVTSLNKWKSKFEEKEKKIHEMEENEEIWRQERKAFMEDLREVKKVKEDLEKKNNRLQGDLVDSRHAIEEKERDYNLRISMIKSKTEAMKAELTEQRKSTSEMEIQHESQVTMLKKDLRRTAEELNQYKESVRELTEVVNTLRENLHEVQLVMDSQKRNYEEKSKAMLNEIKGKNEEVELLRTSLVQLEALPSAMEELEDASGLRSRLISPESVAPTQHLTSLQHYPSFSQPQPNSALLPAIPPAVLPVPLPLPVPAPPQQVISPVIPPPASNIQGGWDEQVTTLITIKAIKNPNVNYNSSNNNRSRHGECTCEPVNEHSPLQDRKQYPGSSSNRRYSDDNRRDYDVHNKDKQNNKVSFKPDDCDILYGPLTKDSSRMIADSDINLFDTSLSTASVPAAYRAKKSPESVDVTGGMRIQDQKCTCKSSKNNEINSRDRSQPRSSSDGRTSKDGEFKNGDQRRSCSCSRPADAKCNCSNPPVSCYCCGCRQTVDKPCNRHRPIPLLLLTKTTDAISQQSNKASEKHTKTKTGKGRRTSDSSENKDKKGKSKTVDKPEIPPAQTRERSTSYTEQATEQSTSFHSDDYGNKDRSTSFHSGDLYGNTGMVDHSTSYDGGQPSSKKPEVPSRKPKLPKGKPPKAGDRKGNKKDDGKDGGLRLPPLQLKDTIPYDSSENTMSKMLCESLESCLDERTYIVCQQLVGDVRNVLEFIPEEPLKKVNLLDSAIERSIGDSKMVNKLEAANKEQNAVVSYSESHNEKGETPQQQTEISTRPSNKAQPKTNSSLSNFPVKNNKLSTKEQPAKKRIERLCTNTKKDVPTPKSNVKPSNSTGPRTRSYNRETSLNKYSPNTKNRRSPGSMVHFESNIKLVQECSVSYETCKNVKRGSAKKVVNKSKVPPPTTSMYNSPKWKNKTKKTTVPEENEVNPFIVSPIRLNSPVNNLAIHELRSDEEFTIMNPPYSPYLPPKKEVVMRKFIDKFLAAPLSEDMRIEEVCSDIVDSDLIINDSIMDLSEVNYSFSGLDIEEEDDKSMNYTIEIVNKPSNSNVRAKQDEMATMSPIPEGISISYDSKFGMIYENTAANDKSLSKMSLSSTGPSSKYFDTKSTVSSVKNSKSRFIFSGRCYSVRGNSCGVKSLPLVVSKQKYNTSVKTSTSTNNETHCDKSFSLMNVSTEKGRLKNAGRKSSSSLDAHEKNTSLNKSKSIFSNVNYNKSSTGDIKQYVNDIIVDKNEGPNNNNLDKCPSFCCGCNFNSTLGGPDIKKQKDCGAYKRTISETELSMRKLKLFSRFENEHIAISNIIQNLHSNFGSERQSNTNVKNDEFEEVDDSCGSSGNLNMEEVYEESVYETSSKEVFSVPTNSIKKNRRFKSKRKLHRLSSRKTRTKVTIKMRKSQTIRGKMFFSNNLTGMLSKINAEIVSAVGMVDRETVNVLSNVSVQLSDTLFKMKALQESSKKVLEMSSQVHDTSLASELEVLSPSTASCRQSPVPAPRKHINSSIKRYHSLTESVGHFECESLPPIMSQSDNGASYNTVTAKELIASFNNINGAVKSEKDKSIYKNVAQPKSIGSFVYDRVTKLTNGLSNTRIMGLKRSVSMVADSKTPPATFYADL